MSLNADQIQLMDVSLCTVALTLDMTVTTLSFLRVLFVPSTVFCMLFLTTVLLESNRPCVEMVFWKKANNVIPVVNLLWVFILFV